MLKGEKKKTYQREYMREYMRAKRQVVKTQQTVPMLRPTPKPSFKDLPAYGMWADREVDADGNIIYE